MDLTLWEYLLAMFGSFVAGAINTLAGNGSVITLSILTDLVGLSGNVANGTNRVGVLLQAAASGSGFAKNKMIDMAKSGYVILMTVAGAIAGVYTAIKVSNEQFLAVFKYVMVLMLIIVLVKPEKWLSNSGIKKKPPMWITIPAFLLLGFYGGFIQMGMGIFFIGVLVLLSNYSIMEANAVKTIVIFIYTIVVLAVFAMRGLVNWEVGLLMAVGQTLGGYLTALYASRWTNINLWAYRLLIVIIIFAILLQFGLLNF